MSEETKHVPDDFNLPYRHRQSTFRLYEPYIVAAVEAAPTPLSINPAPLRPTTFAARLRDALQSYRKYGWETTFTILDLDSADLTVRHTETYVVLGPKGQRGRLPGESLALNNPDGKQVGGLPIARPASLPEVEAFCLLLSGKLLSGPVIFETTELSDTTISDLESRFDVAFNKDSTGKTILI